MKIAGIRYGSGTALAFVVDGGIVAATKNLPPGTSPEQAAWFSNTVALIEAGAAGLNLARQIARQGERTPIRETIFAPPMLPTTILAAGSNYREHNAEKARSPLTGREPEFFIKTSDCVIGHGDVICHDDVLTGKLDCETELAIVIGRPGRHIAVDRAMAHVYGYTVMNDVTARDRQVRRSREGLVWYELGRSKAFDTSAPMGPWIVTADEVGDPQCLAIRTRVNGELRQLGNTSDMIWSCAELIHFFSINFTLKPGMVIMTGTPGGTAWSADPELGGKGLIPTGCVGATRYCDRGDIIENEVEKIGILRNVVA